MTDPGAVDWFVVLNSKADEKQKSRRKVFEKGGRVRSQLDTELFMIPFHDPRRYWYPTKQLSGTS